MAIKTTTELIRKAYTGMSVADLMAYADKQLDWTLRIHPVDNVQQPTTLLRAISAFPTDAKYGTNHPGIKAFLRNLMQTCRTPEGTIDTVKVGVIINRCDPEDKGSTPYHVAAASNNATMIFFLVNLRVLPERDPEGSSLFLCFF